MTEPSTPADRLVHLFERPGHVVAAVLRLLLAAGVAVALILKVYMIVLTDLVCDPAAASLGNTIRCTPTLALLGNAIALAAVIDLASRLLSPPPHRFMAPFMQGVLAFLLLFLAGTGAASATWQQALLLVAGGILLAVVAWVRAGLPPRRNGE